MARAATFTNYLRTELDPSSQQAYRALEELATGTYDRIAMRARAAAAAAAVPQSRLPSAIGPGLPRNNRLPGGQVGQTASQLNAITQAERAAAGATRDSAAASRQRAGALREEGGAARQAAAANDNLARTERAVATNARDATRETRQQGSAARQVSAENAALARSLALVGTTLNVVQGPLGPVAGRVAAIGAALQQLTGISLGLAGAGAALFAFASASNKYAEVESKLRPLYESQTQVNAAMSETVRIALASRSALGATVDLYAKLTNAGRDFGLSQQRISRITELASKAATLSGGTGTTREAGLYQFSQGLASGTLAGDELKSVKENTSELARAIAAGFKNADGSIGTTIGKLKDLAAEGKLTTDVVADAIERAGASIEMKFARLPKTLSSATTELATAFTVMVGRADQATGTTRFLANAVSTLAENLRGLAAAALGVGAAFVAPKIIAFATDMARAVQAQIAFTTAVATGNATMLTAQNIAAGRAALAAEAAQLEAVASQKRVREIEAEIVALKAANAQYAAQIPIAQRAAAATAAAAAQARGAAAAGQFGGGAALQAQAIRDSTILTRYRQQERLTTQALAAAELQLAEAKAVSAGATTRATAATVAATAAGRAAASAAGLLRGVMTGLLAIFNPTTIAIGLLTAGLFYLATASDRSREALDKLGVTQDDIAARFKRIASEAAGASEQVERFARARITGEVSEKRQAAVDLLEQVRSRVSTAAGVAAGNENIPALQALTRVKGQIGEGMNIFSVYSELEKIDKKYPGVLGGNKLLGFNIGKDSSLGAIRKSLEEFDTGRAFYNTAARAGRESIAELGKAGTAAGGGKPAPLTDRQIMANAKAAAAMSDVEKAQARLNQVLADGAAAKKAGTRDDAAYTQQVNDAVAALDAAKDAEKAARAARVASGKATREAAADERQLTRERNAEARDAAQRRLDEGQQDLEERAPSMSRQEYLDARIALLETYDREMNAIDTLARESNRADRQRIADSRAVAGAVREITDSYQRDMQVAQLRIQGRDIEADALGKTLDLVNRYGDEMRDQYAVLVQQGEQLERINSVLEDRQRITSTLQGVVEDTRGAVEQLLNDLPNGAPKAAGDFFKNLQASFRANSARLLTDNLFAGVDQRVRDLISGRQTVKSAVDYASGQFNRAGGVVSTFADVVEGVINRIGLGGSAVAPVGGLGAGGLVGAGIDLSRGLEASLKSGLADIGAWVSSSLADYGLESTGGDGGGDITVIAKKAAAAVGGGAAVGAIGAPKVPTLREVYNETGRSIGEKIDQALGTKFAKNLGGKLGDALKGAGEGAFASSVAGMLGIKQSSGGAAIGGAIGGMIPALGPLGGVIGGLVGGTLGGLFKKAKYGTASIGMNQFGEIEGTLASGRGSQQKAAAVGMAGSVGEALMSITEQLGATISSVPNITIGSYKDKARVSTTGYTGKLSINSKSAARGIVDFGKGGEEEAIQYAIRYSIEHAVIQGISQASVNILKSGQDLQRALRKATLIESIPKRLLAMTNPVRAAIEELNDEFEEIIGALREGGATSQQFVEAQKLYDLTRAKALEEAQKAASTAIDEYLRDMIGSSASPYSKAQTYRNAGAELGRFTADINAGKAVDTDAFLKAVQNYQGASDTLNGRDQRFFDDFEMLQGLLKRAKSNAASGTATEDLSNLPSSPFSSPEVQAAMGVQTNALVAATQYQTQQLDGTLQAILAQLQAQGYDPSTAAALASSMGALPGYGGGGAYYY